MDYEMVDIVSSDGKLTRQALKTDTHKDGALHKIVIGYLKYGEDWALVRQSADKQDAGQFVAPVGGHVQSGESDLDALLRESEEEIGTRNITHRYIGSVRHHRQVIGRDENHLFVIYEIATDDPINLGIESVSLERFTVQGLKQALASCHQDFGDAFYYVLERFYPTYLPANYQK